MRPTSNETVSNLVFSEQKYALSSQPSSDAQYLQQVEKAKVYKSISASVASSDDEDELMNHMPRSASNLSHEQPFSMGQGLGSLLIVQHRSSECFVTYGLLTG